MSWFKKLLPSRIRTESKRGVPEGVWTKCPECQAVLYRIELERSFEVCPKCNYHMRVSGRKRLNYFFDAGSFVELAQHVETVDQLKFRDSKRYKDRLSTAQKTTGEKDALIVGKGRLNAIPVVAVAFDFNFIGGSMGVAVGERFCLGVDQAMKDKVPFVCFSTSGGARMQEAVLSLLQMAKTSASLRLLSDAGLPYISIMTDPTYGGVSASLAMLGDINIAEPRAMIGFTGPRVIAQTVRETLPEGLSDCGVFVGTWVCGHDSGPARSRKTVAGLLGKLMHA